MDAYSPVRHSADYAHFKIELGECWSGEDAGETYNRAGTSDKCVTKDYAKCNPSDQQECVGDQNVNFVYGIDVKGNCSFMLCFLFTPFHSTCYFSARTRTSFLINILLS